MNRLEHLLVILSEECSEVQQDVAKTLRFGVNEEYLDKGTNQQRVRHEYSQLVAMAEMLQAEGFDLTVDRDVVAKKKAAVEKYLLYSKECGTLE